METNYGLLRTIMGKGGPSFSETLVEKTDTFIVGCAKKFFSLVSKRNLI